MSSPADMASKYNRVFSIVSDVYGIDPIQDTLIPEIMKIKTYTLHNVTQDERGSPDLIAIREYGIDSVWWMLMAYNGIGSYKQIVEGLSLKVPDFATIISIVTHLSIRPTFVQRVVTI
jgi:hypothetical protein